MKRRDSTPTFWTSAPVPTLPRGQLAFPGSGLAGEALSRCDWCGAECAESELATVHDGDDETDDARICDQCEAENLDDDPDFEGSDFDEDEE